MHGAYRLIKLSAIHDYVVVEGFSFSVGGREMLPEMAVLPTLKGVAGSYAFPRADMDDLK